MTFVFHRIRRILTSTMSVPGENHPSFNTLDIPQNASENDEHFSLDFMVAITDSLQVDASKFGDDINHLEAERSRSLELHEKLTKAARLLYTDPFQSITILNFILEDVTHAGYYPAVLRTKISSAIEFCYGIARDLAMRRKVGRSMLSVTVDLQPAVVPEPLAS